MKKLIIIGAGGHGKVCADIAMKLNIYKQIFFKDDNKSGFINGIEILNNSIKDLVNDNTEFIVAIGDNQTRKNIIFEVLSLNGCLATLVDPSTIISKNVQIGLGTVVMPNVVVNTNSVIGLGAIINTSSVIEHDCFVKDYVHISPGAILLGNVTVNELCWIGAKSIVIQNKKIEANSVIGAGAVVVDNIEISGTYVGMPAKKI